MRYRFYIAVFAALLLAHLPLVASAQVTEWENQAADCEPDGPTMQMAYCLAAKHQLADSLLNVVYQQAISQIQKSTEPNAAEQEEATRVAQRAWIQFRDADCDRVNAVYASGSIRPVMVQDCLLEHTKQRTVRFMNDHNIEVPLPPALDFSAYLLWFRD
ncbi:MAG: hypothetical protein RhofKO_25720 [Rhodothermales bacterium]